MEFANFLEAAKLRRLDRVGAGYAVAVWLVVQAASIMLPAFDSPAWILRTLIFLALAGLPLVLVAAWHFGGPQIERSDADHSKAHAVLPIVLIVILALSAAQAAYLFWPRGQVQEPQREGVADLSIAVLPFLNMSGDNAKGYFSDGVSEELLNDLSNVPTLRVAARTSSFAFRNGAQDVREIGRTLGVRHVLEGSVREAGDRVRITAQLIDCRDGFHIWSATYDGDLSEILTTQTKIAAQITKVLAGKLHAVPRTQPRQVRIDPQSYREYLEAKQYAAQTTRDAILKSVGMLEDVVKKEPGFSDAFSALAGAYLAADWIDSSQGTYRPKARSAANTALRINPRNGSALYTLTRMDSDASDWSAAVRDLRRLQGINPNARTLALAKSVFYSNLGFFEEAADEAAKSAELDPLSLKAQNWYGYLLLAADSNDLAVLAWKKALALQPTNDIALLGLCDAYASANRLPDAKQLLETLKRTAPADNVRECQIGIYVTQKDFGAARPLIDAMASEDSRGQLASTQKAIAYMHIEDFETAAKWAARAYDAKEITDLAKLPYDPTLPKAFFDHPVWQTIAAKPEIRAWQAERDRVARELAGRI